LGVVSRKPALSEAEGDLQLFFKEHLGHHTREALKKSILRANIPSRAKAHVDSA
jgi:hypothetical protein